MRIIDATAPAQGPVSSAANADVYWRVYIGLACNRIEKSLLLKLFKANHGTATGMGEYTESKPVGASHARGPWEHVMWSELGAERGLGGGGGA